jgi:dolichyl-phosphate beta-glucosyltransferase
VPIDITLILPAYNESGCIARTIGEAVAYFRSRNRSYEIIVAADGTDGTREIVADLGRSDPALRAIGAPARRGKGRGIREAVALASGNIIGFADADNKVPIDEYDKVERAFGDGVSMVIGTRASERSAIERSQPLYRRLGSKGFAVFMRTATGLRGISDTQCGFKFMRHEVGKKLFELQQIDGYMYDVEILLLAQHLGYRVVEVPIRWRDDHDSRLDLVRGNLRNVRDILGVRRQVRAALRGGRGNPA